MAERHSDRSLDSADGGADAAASVKLVNFCVIPRTGQAPLAKKCREVMTCNKSPPPSALMTDRLLSCDQTQRDDLLSHAPIFIEQERCLVTSFQEGYNPTSTEAIVQAVYIEKHTLSLGGRSLNCPDTMFKEYSHVCHGTLETIYFYECCKYPGHYIRWYCDGSTVDCEPNTSTPHKSYYQWQKIAVNDNAYGGLNYNLLVAYNSNPSLVSPAYLTFEEQQPMIQSDVTKAAKFLISYLQA